MQHDVRRFLFGCSPVLLAAGLLLAGRGATAQGAPSSGWGGYGGSPYGMGGSVDAAGQAPRPLEAWAGLAVQTGVVAPGGSRSPTSLAVSAGVGCLSLDLPRLGGRVLHGPFITFPFSFEINWGSDIVQFAPGVGWQFMGRPSKHWAWTFAILASMAASTTHGGKKAMKMGGPGVSLGAVYYFLSGFGLFGQVNVETWFGSKNALTAGVSVGLLVSYEWYKERKKGGAAE